MKLNLIIAGIASMSLDHVTSLEVDGKAYVAPGSSAPGEKLAPIYFDAADLANAVVKVAPPYPVWVDSDVGPNLNGSAASGLPIRYGSQDPKVYPNPMIVLMTPDHPYFNEGAATAEAVLTTEHVKAMAAAAPFVQEVYANGFGGKTTDPTKAWEEGVTTTDPDSVNFLIYYAGPGGIRSSRMALGNLYTYVRRFGRQAPAPAPIWRSSGNWSDAQIAQMVALPQSYVDALVKGEDPGAWPLAEAKLI